MDVKSLLDGAWKELGPLVEAKAKDLINQYEDQLVDKILAEIAALIPGSLDDQALAFAAPTIKAKLKELALKQAEQIS